MKIASGIVLFALATTSWFYSRVALNTPMSDRPQIARRFGNLLYYIPLILGLMGILLGGVFSLFGTPIGLITGIWIKNHYKFEKP